MNESNLHDYQLRCVRHCLTNPCAGLFLEPGLGKSVTALTVVKRRASKALVIAPKAVANNVWPFEHIKWDHLSDLKVVRWHKKVTNQETLSADVVVVHIEQMEGFFATVPLRTFDTLIIDESSRFKSPTSKRFKLLKSHYKEFENRIILTGTPTPQGIWDLWSQIGILDGGARLGTAITKFRETYLLPEKIDPRTKVVWKYKEKTGARQIITNKISDIVVSLKAEDYLQMPETIITHHAINWPKPARIQYDQMKKDMVVELNSDVVTAVSAGALTNKLMQFTSGWAYNENKEPVEIQTAKMEYLVNMLEDAPPSIVFYHYQSTLEEMKRRISHAVEYNNDPAVLTRWNKGEVPVLLLHPMSAGIGLNLQCNATDSAQIIWYDAVWSSELYIQANARVRRQGQTKPVFIHHLQMFNSIDHRVAEVCSGKITIQDALMEELR